MIKLVQSFKQEYFYLFFSFVFSHFVLVYGIGDENTYEIQCSYTQ